jgi:hypothetical protein
MSADKLASFRVDGQLWEQFQSHAKENNTNASALLVAYIKSVVNTGNVITSNPVVNTSSESNNPSLLIQDIDKRIDEKIKQSIQNIDTINTLSLQDIDNRIIDSIKQGDIKDAIATSYAGMMAQFNGLLEEWQELQKQVEELQSIPPVPVPQSPITEELTTDNEELTIDNEEPTTDNGQLTNEILTTLQETDDGQFSEDVESDSTDSENKSDTQSPITDEEQAEKNKQSHEEYVQKYLTPKPEKQRLDPAIYTRNYQIVSMLDCQFWMDGKKFNQQDLKDNGIDKNIAKNKAEIETLLGKEIKTKNSGIQRFVGILRAMGFEVEGGLKDGYYIANPEIFN